MIGRAALRLDGVICLLAVLAAPPMAILALVQGDRGEAGYWAGGWLVALVYGWMLLREWGDEE